MIAVISPAKSLDFETDVPDLALTNIRFPDETAQLAKGLGNMSKKKLQTVIPVSNKLIDLNYSRYREFSSQPQRAAIYAYNGDVYTGFEAQSLDEESIQFAQNHVRILSGLYGLLRPLDPIQPHRLEMGTKWAPRLKKLTDFWKDKIAQELSGDLAESGGKIIVNLASNEYWAAVKPYAKRLEASIIGVDFRHKGLDGPKFISFEAKRARGMMARYICENHLQDAESLKAFDYDGYVYDEQNSTPTLLSFVRS